MLDNIIICRLYRTIWRPKKATKSATFEIPNWFHKSLKNQRHICSTFIRKFVNDVWSSKQWTSDSLEQRLFLRPFWPYSLHTFSLVSLVKKYATCKAKMAFQKAFVHGNLTFIVFLIPSLTFFIMNVEKIQCLIPIFWNIFSVLLLFFGKGSTSQKRCLDTHYIMSLLKHGTWYHIKKQHINLIQIFQNFGDNVRLKEHTSTPHLNREFYHSWVKRAF